MSKELLVVNKEESKEVFTMDGVNDLIAKVKTTVGPIVYDVSTAKGRENIRSTAAKIAKTRKYIDDIGKEYVADLKALPKKVDAARKHLRDELDDFRDEYRKPLTEYEDERKRIDQLKISLQAKLTPMGEVDSQTLKDHITEVDSIDLESIPEDRKADFLEVHGKVSEGLGNMLEDRLKHEAEQKELEEISDRLEVVAGGLPETEWVQSLSASLSASRKACVHFIA